MHSSTVERAVTSRFRRAGYDGFSAEQTASHLVGAELDGCTSHGLQLIPEYLTEIDDGKVNPSAAVKIVGDDRSQLVFDAQAAPGHGALATVVKICEARAEDTGLVVAWTSSLAHTGRLAYYLLPVLARPCIMMLSVSSLLDPASSLVAAPGSKERVLGSNPIAVGISSPDGAVAVYDGSSSATSFYRLLEYHRRHERLPTESLVAADGNPSDDPQEFFNNGSISSAGGHRGFGLSLLMSMLTLAKVPLPASGLSSAFLVLVPADAMPGLQPVFSSLGNAGVYIPGTRMISRSRRADSTVELKADVWAMLLANGIELL